jgi:hypothetical protein
MNRVNDQEEFKVQSEMGRPHTTEGRLTLAIEEQTSRVPSSLFLGLAFGAIAVSAALKISGRNSWALFVGQWAAPLLIMGSYNKMVKQHGSDANTAFEAA